MNRDRLAVASRSLVALCIAVALITGCGRSSGSRDAHPDWVIRSRVVFVAADRRTPRVSPPLESFRVWFPYVIGDLYGAPGTGDFIRPVIRSDYSFEIDLNPTEPDLRMSLEPTELSLSFLQIVPREARIARLAPAVLQARGIDPLGVTDWIDADTGERLMLIYADRPAQIVGRTASQGHLVQYDVRIESAGYAWVRSRAAEGATLYSVVAAPRHVWLAVAPPG